MYSNRAVFPSLPRSLYGRREAATDGVYAFQRTGVLTTRRWHQGVGGSAADATISVSKPGLPVTGINILGLAVTGAVATLAGLLVLLTLVRRHWRRPS